MNVRDWILRQLGATRVAEPISLRRWDAAKTHRLNEQHWSNATGASLNSDLDSYLSTIRMRSAYEYNANAALKGIVATHVSDLVGANGPQLQVNSDDDAYNDALEALVFEWSKSCDASGSLRLADVVSLWVTQLWWAGEYFSQIINDPSVSSGVKMRLNNIDPKRIDSPIGANSVDDKVVMGILRNEYGRPIAYYVLPPDDSMSASSLRTTTVRARDMIHNFIIDEPGQARGVPWIACALQTLADIHDLDHQIMDAMKAAAENGVILHTDHPDAEFVSANESTTLERGTMKTAPPGWKPFQMTPQQPGTNTIAYRDERLREAGAPANMPLLKIKRDASNHNYSSARFDALGYWTGLDWLRARIVGNSLNRCVDAIEREGQLLELLKDKRPANLRYEWRWPQRPQIDPLKEASAEELGLANNTLLLKDAVIARGKDYEQHMKDLEKEAVLLSKMTPKREVTEKEKAQRNSRGLVADVLMQHLEETEKVNGKTAHL